MGDSLVSNVDFNLFTEADTGTKSLKMINMTFHRQLTALTHSTVVCEIN